MPGFYGYRSVLADYRKQLRTGKVVTGTLRVRTAGGLDTFTDVAWKALYVWPQTEVSGFKGNHHPDIDGVLTLYRLGESNAPRVDDQVVVNGITYLIFQVYPRLNADEASGFAVYDLTAAS